jgi:outer membrane protein assembly factor BamB
LGRLVLGATSVDADAESASHEEIEPLATSEDLAPDTSTPVVLGGMVFGSFGGLLCLDLDDGLKTLWRTDEGPLADYCTLIAGNDRVLITTQTGKLYLIHATKKGFACVGNIELFEDVAATEREIWSHPALVGNRLYVRNLLGVYCFLIE